MGKNMANFLKDNWFKLAILIIIFVITGGSFYWFQWRPSQIRIECEDYVKGEIKGKNVSFSDASVILNFCIKSKGLSN